MIYVLDSDTLIFLIRGTRIVVAKSRSQRLVQEAARNIEMNCKAAQAANNEVSLSVITVAELEFGARHSGNYEAERRDVDLILRPFTIFDFTARTCAQHYGEIREEVESLGRPIGAMDLLIAAHARAMQAVLVTNNIGDFGPISRLRTENWAMKEAKF